MCATHHTTRPNAARPRRGTVRLVLVLVLVFLSLSAWWAAGRGVLRASTGGGSVRVKPLAPLAPCTAYTLRITAALKDVSGVSVQPFTVSFGTAAAARAADPAVRFEKVRLPDTSGEGYTCV